MNLIDKIKRKIYRHERIMNFYMKCIKPLLMLNKYRNANGDTEEFLKAYREFEDFPKQITNKRILAVGHVGLPPAMPYLTEVLSELPQNYELALLYENATEFDNAKKILFFDNNKRIKPFIVPSLFYKDCFIPYEKIKGDIKWDFIKNTDYLQEAYENLITRHYNMTLKYAGYLVYNAYHYLDTALDLLQPDCVIMWNQFFAFHHILEGLCRKKGIKCIYFEFGVLPGTYAFETMGQMGESYPAIMHEEFKKLYVNEKEIKIAQNICNYIKSSRINRKPQPLSNINQLLSRRIKKERPTIFYAGQNDFESGLCPYTKRTKKFHSPIFESSDHAMRYLAELANKNDWNLIYKMHPLVSIFCTPPKHMPKNVILINNADINDLVEYSDLTVTILSQTGYVALFHDKPVLMLGYIQLKGSGCTYEAFSLDKIEETIFKALENGYTKAQKEAFYKHIAQVSKYYIYNDPWFEKEFTYGQDIKSCAQKIYDIMRLKET